jgi:hypothetical protein
MRKRPIAPDVDFEMLTKFTLGFSGAGGCEVWHEVVGCDCAYSQCCARAPMCWVFFLGAFVGEGDVDWLAWFIYVVTNAVLHLHVPV